MPNRLKIETEAASAPDSRRAFLHGIAIAGVGLATMGAAPGAIAKETEAPIDVVRSFCAAWTDNVPTAELVAFFTDDAIYHNIPMAPVSGKDAIAKTLSSFIRPGAPGVESIEFRVLNIAANGPIVMTERVDVFKLPNKTFELPVMGIFEISGGKIKAWRDYFDRNQFATRRG